MNKKNNKNLQVVGKDHPRVDVQAKVTGACDYVSDMTLPGMLHCKVLRSPHAHAMVNRIDSSKAEQLPGVRAVITHQDVKDCWLSRAASNNSAIPSVMDAHILEEHVRFVGDRVVAIVADTAEIAEEALTLINVDYDVLPAVFDIEKAADPDAPVIHESIKAGEDMFPIEYNTNFMPIENHAGDVESGFKQADLIVENEFRTGAPHHMPVGRPACICKPLPDGRLEVWTHSQGIHPTRKCLGESLNMPFGKIKVHRISVGGAFGLYIYLHMTDAVCAFLAMKTGLPVKLEDTREEMFYDGGRHPAQIRLKTGVMKDGTIVSMAMDFLDGIGAYGTIPDISGLAGGFFMSKIHCPNMRFIGKTVYTNTPPLCAMRGAGNPQIHFAVESQLDIIADKLGMDPLELRSLNNIRTGDHYIGQAEEVFCNISSCGLEEAMREGARRIGWDDRHSRIPYPEKPWIKRGIGMASGFHSSGAGTEVPASYISDYSGAMVKMNEDGSANLILAATDFGSGNTTAIATIAAEELGVCYEDIIVSESDTDTSLYEFWIHASRSVYSVGEAARKAAQKTREIFMDWASELTGISQDDLVAKNRRIYQVSNPEQSVSIREVLEWAQSLNKGTAAFAASHRATSCPPHFVATFLMVDVDTRTGEIKIVKAIHGADVGVPINPSAVHGQLIGGLHMGLGYALTEHVVYAPDTGKVLNPGFTDYKLLTPIDMPEVDTFLVDSEEPTGPFGAKGIGEGSTNPVAPAVYNAVFAATGVRVFSMPLTPEKVLAALSEKGEV